MWKNIVDPARPQMTIRSMHIASWITETTNAHSENVIIITFTLQRLFHESASMSSYNYIACQVYDCQKKL